LRRFWKMGTDETLTDVSPVGEETPASVSPQDQTPETPVSRGDLEALEQRLTKAMGNGLESVVQRTKQSSKATIDHRVKKAVGERMKDYEEVLGLLSPHLREGVDPEQLKKDAALSFLYDEVSRTPEEQPEGNSQASEPSRLEKELSEIMRKHGLTGKEPDIDAYLKENEGKPWYSLLAGIDQLGVEIAKRRTPSAAGITSTKGGPSPRPDLVEAYKKDMLKARGRRDMIKATVAKYRDLGVKVDEIDLTDLHKQVSLPKPD
jgi:hypothetical protein